MAEGLSDLNNHLSQPSNTMATRKTIELLSQVHPGIWNASTDSQRRDIRDRFERTGDLKFAFKGFSARKVVIADLSFDTVGSRRIV